MTTVIIISAYIISVFVSRWLNKVTDKIEGIKCPCPVTWFVPVLNVPAWMIMCLVECCSSSNSKPKVIKWFIGENW